MRFLAVQQAAALLLTLASSAAPALASPWFIGEFRGAPPEAGAADPQMFVRCRPNAPCTVLTAKAGDPPKPVGIRITAPPQSFDPQIPNNNWEGTRDAAAQEPDLYKHPTFGPLLRPLRPALQSGARLAACVDLDDNTSMALCSLSTDPDAKESVMLLINTMNGACGSLPFCAYYFVPLARIRE